VIIRFATHDVPSSARESLLRRDAAKTLPRSGRTVKGVVRRLHHGRQLGAGGGAFSTTTGFERPITTAKVLILKRSTVGPIVAVAEPEIDEDATK